MFSILDRYIGKTILKVISLTLFLLISLSGIIRFIEQLRRLRGDYDVVNAAIYTFLTIPKDLEVFFPIATLIGALIGLGLLASKSELVVMEASGFSRYKIALAALKTAIPLVFIVMLISEYIMPPSDQFARNLRYEKSYGRSTIQNKGNMWLKDENNIIHIGHISDEKRLNNIKLYEVKDHQLITLTQATSAEYNQGSWYLNQVEVYHLQNKKQLSLDRITSKKWDSSVTPEELKIIAIDPDSLSAAGLYQYANYLKSTAQDDSHYRLLFWQKVFEPLSVAVMVLLALSYIFGPLRSVSMGVRIIAGISTGFVFYIMNNLFAQMAIVAGLPAVFSALLTTILFSFIALWLFTRSNKK